jgi:hypothetical protein
MSTLIGPLTRARESARQAIALLNVQDAVRHQLHTRPTTGERVRSDTE